MNGWKNYETWNVVLWVGNDERFYRLASECRSFAEFRKVLSGIDRNHPVARETPDGVSWDDPNLDLQAIADWWNDTFPMPCRKLAKSIEEFGIPKGGF